jgi:hypothetical protein
MFVVSTHLKFPHLGLVKDDCPVGDGAKSAFKFLYAPQRQHDDPQELLQRWVTQEYTRMRAHAYTHSVHTSTQYLSCHEVVKDAAFCFCSKCAADLTRSCLGVVTRQVARGDLRNCRSGARASLAADDSLVRAGGVGVGATAQHHDSTSFDLEAALSFGPASQFVRVE